MTIFRYPCDISPFVRHPCVVGARVPIYGLRLEGIVKALNCRGPQRASMSVSKSSSSLAADGSVVEEKPFRGPALGLGPPAGRGPLSQHVSFDLPVCLFRLSIGGDSRGADASQLSPLVSRYDSLARREALRVLHGERDSLAGGAPWLLSGK